MIKIITIDFLLHFFLKDITITDLLFNFTNRINTHYAEDDFYAIFISWLRVVFYKKITIGSMKDIIKKSSNLRSFNDFSVVTSEIYEKFSISTSLLMRNYSKIGLNHFYVWIKFSNNNRSQENLEKFFFKVPFFSHFIFVNRTCQFSCYIPASIKRTIIDYLKSLQDLKILDGFYFDLIIESKFTFEFENTFARDQKVYEMIPFLSKKFRQNKSIPPNMKNLPKFALVNHSQTYPKPIFKIDPTFDALDFYIFFKIENLIIGNETVHNLLKKDLLVSSILNLKSKQIKKTYDLFFTDNLIPDDKTTINEFEKLIREKYPKKKSIEKLIILFRVLEIPDTSHLTTNLFEKYLKKIGNEFYRYFFKRSDHSIIELKKKFNQLFDEGYLKKYINFFTFLVMNPNIIYLNISGFFR